MICSTCNKKNICKHYDYIINTTDVDITVNSCKYSSVYSNGVTSIRTNHDYTKTIKPNPYVNTDPGFTLLNRSTSGEKPAQYQTNTILKTKDFSMDLRELSNKVNNDRVNESFKVTSVPTELSKCDNPDCKADVYEEDKTTCSVCGKAVCPVCSYTDMHELNSIGDSIDSVNTVKVICEDCHNKKEAPKKTKKKTKKTAGHKKPIKSDNPFDIDIFEK